jgi:CHASE2 domain-containing sensor protein
MDRRGRVLALIGGIAFLITAVLVWRPSAWMPALGDLEWPFYDWHLRATALKKPLSVKDSPVVIVGMEDETPIELNLVGVLDDPFYPLPRSFHGRVLKLLERAQVSAIGFDIVFTEESDDDEGFKQALKTRSGTLAATRSTTNDEGIETFVPLTKSLPGLVPASVEVPRSLGRSVRHFEPLVQDGTSLDQHIPHLGVALAAAGAGELWQPAQLTGGYLRWGTLQLPIAASLSDRATLIHYRGPEGTFPKMRYDDIWISKTPPEDLKGKLVLVGRYSPLEDRHMTPLGEMTGVEILANIAYMSATQKAILTTESWSLWVGLVLISTFLWLVWRFTLAPALLVPLVLGAAWVFWAHFSFIRAGVWWESATPLLMLGLATALATP